ncbi:MAG: MBL fold metallo-hydrolase [Armatimonadota bacterium]
MHTITKISRHCSVIHSHINIGMISSDKGILLIDFGDGSFLSLLEPNEISDIDTILMTHHHRDQACGLIAVPKKSYKIIVPEAERGCFEKTDEYWNDPANRWHGYYYHPHRFMLTESVRVDGVMRNGDTLEWGTALITAISTPGHTDGSMTYIVDVDDRRIAFTGDLIYDTGKVLDLHSLQKGHGVMDYHGFMGAWVDVKTSLLRLLDTGITDIVPSHGNIMHNSSESVKATISVLEDVYTRFIAISALRTHIPDYVKQYSNSPISMPIRPTFDPPGYLHHLQTTWILISNTGAAFVMDCYSDEIIRLLQDWINDGVITSVEGLWVTHYHDDHVEAIPEFQKVFDCKLIADRSVADVISSPAKWHLPCLSPNAARVDRSTEDGETWTWHEFKMTAYHFPGQTIHHGGLLVENQDDKLFFAGDSFAPGGIDDYCAYNRNQLGEGVGYDRCLKILRGLKPNYIFNSHMDKAFSFTDENYEFMYRNLIDREDVLTDLMPWEDPNYGIDNAWAYCMPYEQNASRGDTINIDLAVTNYTNSDKVTGCKAHIPNTWGYLASVTASTTIPCRSQGNLSLVMEIPSDAPIGRYIIPIDVTHGEIWIPQYTEAIVTVSDPPSI